MSTMSKRRIRFDTDALMRLIDKVTAHGLGTRTDIVAAMNADQSDDGKVTLNQLKLWAEEHKPVKLQRLVSLVNNMENVSLNDFFVYEDTGEPASLQPREPRRRRQSTGPEADASEELLMIRIECLQEKERIRTECDGRMADMQRIMQATIDAQQAVIDNLRERLSIIDDTKKEGDRHSVKTAADNRR